MTQPQSILVLAHSAQRGGAEYCLQTTLEHLDRSLFRPLVVFPTPGPMMDEARALGLDVLSIPLCHWMCFDRNAWYWKHLVARGLTTVLHLRLIVLRHSIKLVYSNTATVFQGALAARLARIPHVWHIHEVLSDDSDLNPILPIPRLKSLIRRLSTTTVFESQASRDVFEAGDSMPNSLVIHNSLRTPTVAPEDSDTARRTLGLPVGTTLVGFLGRLSDRKNPLLLLDAAEQVIRETTSCHFVIAGEGELQEAILRRVHASGLASHVTLLPFQNDIGHFMSAIDLLVLPSKQESFGLVLIEAAAYGKPSIACVSQGPSDIIVDSLTGYLTEQNNPSALAGHIIALARNPELLSHLGRNAKEHVSVHFDPRHNVSKLQAAFSRLTQQPTS